MMRGALVLSPHFVTLQGRELLPLVSTWINLTHSLVCRYNNCRCCHELISHYTEIILITIQTLLIILYTLTTFFCRISLCTTFTIVKFFISFLAHGAQFWDDVVWCRSKSELAFIHSLPGVLVPKENVYSELARYYGRRAVLRGCCVGL